jgi:ABC-type multidrug transport system fused ATPase/permease subunit
LGASLRLRELFDVKPTLKDGTRETSPLREAIEFRRACFGYSDEAVLLHDISLRLPRGAVVAIVGPSGAGKSTLADLLLRLHDPTSGSVTYDDVDVREFVQASYRGRFGVVAEEPLLIHASVEENIVYGRPFVRQEVERAAHIANADEFIARLPEGYATLVGERGARLSRGERQRISIARAVYGRPDILVLDEATSALDSESERMVQNAIDRALSETTAVVIAHRLSTVINADNIVVLDKGRIVASGRHAELLERSALYRRLSMAQRAEGNAGPSQAHTALV